MRLFNESEVVSHAISEHFIEKSHTTELYCHGLYLLHRWHLHVDPKHHLVEVVFGLFGSLHDPTGVFLFKDSASESVSWVSVEETTPGHVFSKENLVDVHFFQKVGAHSLETCSANFQHLLFVLFPEGLQKFFQVIFYLGLQDGKHVFQGSINFWLFLLVLVDAFDGIVVFFLPDIEGCFFG